MKHIYITFFLLFSLTSFSQDEILGEWHLKLIHNDGVAFFNYYGSGTIEIGEAESLITFGGSSICNAITGEFTNVGNNILLRIGFVSTNSSCGQIPRDIFDEKYISILESQDSQFTYSVDGVGNEQTLTLSNSDGNYVVYGKLLETAELIKTWYLSSIEVDGDIINVPTTYTSVLNLTYANSFIPSLSEFYGIGGECNEFFGSYKIYENNTNTIEFPDVAFTLAECGNLEYENIYFQILGDYNNNTFDFEVLNYDATLILTDALNRKLTYNSFSLTIDNDLSGNWFLHYRVIDGIEVYNNLTTEEMFPSINFTENRYSEETAYLFDGNGPCESFSGPYSVIDYQTIKIDTLFETLGSGCSTQAGINFNEGLYFGIIYSGDEPNLLHYEISGTGNDAILTLTNLTNNNVAVYGRQTLSTTDVALNKSIIKLKENPVKDQLEIVVQNASFNQISYTIYADDGKVISNSKTLENNTISLKNLNQGLYFIKILTDDSQTQTLKFIKE